MSIFHVATLSRLMFQACLKFLLQSEERTEDKSFEAKKAYKAVVPNLLVTKGQFHGRLYFHILGVGGDGFGKIRVHYIKFALYFCYFISSSSDHQASDTSGR